MSANSRLTKILATLGPASSDAETMRGMLEAGLDGARLNMSHGDPAGHRSSVRLFRRESRRLGRPTSLVLDLQGPKLRTAGPVPEDGVELLSGGRVVLVGRTVPATPRRLGVSMPSLARRLRPRERVLIDDGKLRLRVRRIRGDEVHCDVEVGGRIGTRRGVNLPDTSLSLPALTRKDQRDLELGIALGVDYIALSFVSSGNDVRALRRRLQRAGADLRIVAKLERPRALDNLDDILEHADGVMVARGDLGVEIPVEQVPAAQKHIIARAGERGRLVITATQMLETMIEKPTPTRAEVSDVANAVFDGTDVVMLSGETAVGHDPVRVVETMSRIVRGAETRRHTRAWLIRPSSRNPVRAVIAESAASAARALQARALVVLTMSGNTALTVSKHHLHQPIYAITYRDATVRRTALYRGVTPVRHRFHAHSDRLLAEIERALVRSGQLARGDRVAYVGGANPGGVATDFLQVRRVGAPRRSPSG